MVAQSQFPSNVEATSEVIPAPKIETNGGSKKFGSAVIRVLGVGGGGSNAVSRMFKEKVKGVDYYCINTDAQHLARCEVSGKIPIGQTLTRGLGVGGNSELGRQAAEESRDQLSELVQGTDMVFVTAGMGGGTGTGAVPVVAELAKESGALTVAVVTKPFSFEVSQRRKSAEDGISKLKEIADTLIIIPNDRLLQMGNKREQNYTWDDGLHLADSVLAQGIQSIAEVVTVPGQINVDFADVKTIMAGAGPAWMAIGKGKGENRAIEAAKMATKSPLLDIAIEGAKRLLFVISGGSTLTLKEVRDASETIQEMADPEANIIFGTSKDPKMEDEVKVTLIAAQFPMPMENLADREAELDKLLKGALPEEHDLDAPSFLRKDQPRPFLR